MDSFVFRESPCLIPYFPNRVRGMAGESDRKAAERVPGCFCTHALSDLATQRVSPP
jgi:hypothetical protein